MRTNKNRDKKGGKFWKLSFLARAVKIASDKRGKQVERFERNAFGGAWGRERGKPLKTQDPEKTGENVVTERIRPKKSPLGAAVGGWGWDQRL